MPRNPRLSLPLQSASSPTPFHLLLLLVAISLLNLTGSASSAALYTHTQTTWPLVCRGDVPRGANYQQSDFASLLSFCGDHGTDNHPAADCSCVFPVDSYYDSYDDDGEGKKEGEEERRNGVNARVVCEGDARLQLALYPDSLSASGMLGGAGVDFCEQRCLCPGHPEYPMPYGGEL